MAKTLTLCDEYGIIYQAMKILPDDQLKIGFLENASVPIFLRLRTQSRLDRS